MGVLDGNRLAFFVAASDASAKSKAVADWLCSGTADDVQIQAAIDALPAGGGKVVLSEGTFNPAAEIAIAAANTTLQGQGPSTILKPATNANLARVIFVNGVADVTLLDFAADGNSANQSSGNGQGINFFNSPRTKLYRITIYDTRGDGIVSALGTLAALDAEIAHCDLRDLGIHGINLVKVENVRVHHNAVRDYANVVGGGVAIGIRLEGCEEITLDSNHVLGDGSLEVGKFCMQIGATCKNIIFADNVIEDSDDDGIQISDSSGVQATRNTILNSQGPGFGVLSMVNLTIAHNIITACDDTGILIGGTTGNCSDIVVESNQVVDGTSDGIGVDSGATNSISRVLIKHNVVTGHDQGGKVGINVVNLNGGSNVRVEDNILENNTANIVLATGATKRNNIGDVASGDVVVITKTIDHADLTDGGDATAYFDFDDTIPAGSIIKAVKIDFTEAWNSSDTATITMQIGPQADLDDFSKTGDPGDDIHDTTTDMYWGESACQDPVVVSAAAPRVTLTEDNDGTHLISGGSATGGMTITITYMKA